MIVLFCTLLSTGTRPKHFLELPLIKEVYPKATVFINDVKRIMLMLEHLIYHVLQWNLTITVTH